MATRALPQAVDAERALLGGLIQQPDLIPLVDELVQAGDFYRPDHSALYALLSEMAQNDESIDMVTVPERIARDGQHERYGGVSYVVELPDYVPSTANLAHYAEVVRDKSMLRALIGTSEELAARAFGQSEEVNELLDSASEEFFKLGRRHTRRDWRQVSLIVDEEITRIEKLCSQDSSVTGAQTGFIDLDKILSGFHPGELIILAARPAMGKTALALNIVQNLAMIEGVSVGVFSLEMARGQLVTRMLSCTALVDAGRVRTGQLSQEDWQRMMRSSEMLRSIQLHIDDTPALTLSDVRARAKRLKEKHNDLGLIVVDYLQLMQGPDSRVPREQQISAISRGLKALAKDLELPVLALSQLNRGVESRQDKRPILSDLRESGAIEQDADVIMFIYRDEYYHTESLEKGLADVIIGKHRNGPTGLVKLTFQGKYTRFDNYAPDDFTI